MLQEDWMMRQIESMVGFLTLTVLKKKQPGRDRSNQESGTDTEELKKRLASMVREGKINEAENLLFETVDDGDQSCLDTAIDFYSGLNRLDRNTLEKNGFSREEIEDGLKEIASRFGISLDGLF